MANCSDDHYYKSARSLDTFEKFPVSSGDQSVQFYTNPVIKQNAPDPSVVRLADGTGWVAIVTSDHSSRYAHDPRAFPLYYSRDLINWELRSWVFGEGTGRDGPVITCGLLNYTMSTADTWFTLLREICMDKRCVAQRWPSQLIPLVRTLTLGVPSSQQRRVSGEQ